VKWGAAYASQALEDAKKLAAEGMKPEAQGLLEVLEKDPFRNAPAFEKPTGDLDDPCSRRINIPHRLVFEVFMKERKVRVLRTWTHSE
jgi:Txe/YoeB family toxin of toxin-antitoxin system